MRRPCPTSSWPMEDDHRSLTPAFVGTCGGCLGLQGSADLVSLSSEPCPELPISFSHWSKLLPSPRRHGGTGSQSGIEDHHCARDSPAHAVGPRGHGKKQSIVSQNSCLVTKERSVESQSVGFPPATGRRVTHSYGNWRDGREAIPLPGSYLTGNKSPSTSLANTCS